MTLSIAKADEILPSSNPLALAGLLQLKPKALFGKHGLAARFLVTVKPNPLVGGVVDIAAIYSFIPLACT